MYYEYGTGKCFRYTSIVRLRCIYIDIDILTSFFEKWVLLIEMPFKPIRVTILDLQTELLK